MFFCLVDYSCLFVCTLRFSCDNCSIELLQNASECCCCKEIENCVQFLAEFSEDSVQTVTDKGTLQCVIEHPGFQSSCLNRWSLELATGNYKTRDGHRYSQSGSNFKEITCFSL